eukprot:scaffold72252_cov72-Phaeocystis_antarctica.AAC.1
MVVEDPRHTYEYYQRVLLRPMCQQLRFTNTSTCQMLVRTDHGADSEVPVILSITRPSGTSARSTLAHHPPAVGQSYAARQAAVERPTAGGRRAKLERADVPDGNVQRQVWRGARGSREGWARRL